VSVQVHLLPRGAVEEFLVETPAEADLHDLVDVPTRVLTSTPLAAATGGELSRALRALLGECAIGWQEADEVHRGAGLEEGLEGTTIRLCDPAGGLLTLERPRCRLLRPSSPEPVPCSNWNTGLPGGSPLNGRSSC
jgi:hypothetical protein